MPAALVSIKSADEDRTYADGASIYPDSELSLTLASGSAYWISAGFTCYLKSTFATRLYAALQFSGTIETGTNVSHMHRFRSPVQPRTIFQSNEFSGSALWGSSVFSTVQVYNSYGSDSTYRGAVQWKGFLYVDTGGTLTVDWCKGYNGSGGDTAITVHKGAYLIAQELNLCGV